MQNLLPFQTSSITFPSGFENPDALALFSGGLDSILAAKLLQEQGVRVLCLHFISPFFGKPDLLEHWQRIYNLTIIPVHIEEQFVDMLKKGPAHGVGSVINPCVDCKILMISVARELMLASKAKCIVTGEVLGQRPMSQRRDTLNIIRRDAMVRDYLLRPLCAKLMDPTKIELDGIVDREQLLSFSGRGRKDQLTLAKKMGLEEIPTPGGGCLLTEKENARSYWPVLAHHPNPAAPDFNLANTGRQYWCRVSPDGSEATSPFWLSIGRNQQDNDNLQALATENDLIFKTKDFPGPIAIGRQFPQIDGSILEWPEEIVMSAAAFVASFSPKAMRYLESCQAEAGGAGNTAVRVHTGSTSIAAPELASGGELDKQVQAYKLGLDAPGRVVTVIPSRSPVPAWAEYNWAEARECITKALRP